MRKIFLLFVLCVFLSSCSDTGDDGKIPIYINDAKLMVEVADTPAEHSLGLMFRESLDENNGMLFVYTQSDTLHFWMKNTKIPLSAAFVSETGEITEIIDMTPFNETRIVSKNKTMYVIEANRGWFERNNVKVGDKVNLEALKQ